MSLKKNNSLQDCIMYLREEISNLVAWIIRLYIQNSMNIKINRFSLYLHIFTFFLFWRFSYFKAWPALFVFTCALKCKLLLKTSNIKTLKIQKLNGLHIYKVRYLNSKYFIIENSKYFQTSNLLVVISNVRCHIFNPNFQCQSVSEEKKKST